MEQGGGIGVGRHRVEKPDKIPAIERGVELVLLRSVVWPHLLDIGDQLHGLVRKGSQLCELLALEVCRDPLCERHQQRHVRARLACNGRHTGDAVDECRSTPNLRAHAVRSTWQVGCHPAARRTHGVAQPAGRTIELVFLVSKVLVEGVDDLGGCLRIVPPVLLSLVGAQIPTRKLFEH